MININTELNKVRRFANADKEKKDFVIKNLLCLLKYTNGIIFRQEFEKGNFRIQYLGQLHERRIEFEKNVLAFEKKYPINMLKAFYDYWSELNQNGTKMRWEMQDCFEIGKRLATWNRKNQTYYKNNYSTKYR